MCAQRRVHYEKAFEDYLRQERIPYIAVDEAKRSLLPEVDVKNADFIVHAGAGRNLIVDIKGKHFPYSHQGQRTYWESWVHKEDLEGLAIWQDLLGEGFEALLVYAYWLRNVGDPHVEGELFSTLHRYGNRDYAFVAASMTDFASLQRVRSRSWQAVDLARRDLFEVLRPFGAFVGRGEEGGRAGGERGELAARAEGDEGGTGGGTD